MRDERVQLSLIRDVRGDRGRLVPGRGQTLRLLGDQPLAPGGEHDARAGLGEPPRRGQADTGRREPCPAGGRRYFADTP